MEFMGWKWRFVYDRMKLFSSFCWLNDLLYNATLLQAKCHTLASAMPFIWAIEVWHLTCWGVALGELKWGIGTDWDGKEWKWLGFSDKW